ncbi:MAG: hypothetical protein U9Q15_05560 [Patescibacteria group bacterium]|nr:hypothetical protein [Patescibacteria group bacterium]
MPIGPYPDYCFDANLIDISLCDTPSGPYPAFCITAKQREMNLSVIEWQNCSSETGPYPEYCNEQIQVFSGSTQLTISQYASLFDTDIDMFKTTIYGFTYVFIFNVFARLYLFLFRRIT